MHAAHQAICTEADNRAIDARQLACTLLFAVIGQRGAALGQIGDGAMVEWRDGAYEQIFWPQSGEYVNTTNFITHPKFESFLDFSWRDCAIDELAMFTDGLQMLGLDYQQRRAHGPFFAPMFASLRARANPEDLTEPMRAFLKSPGLAEPHRRR